MENDSSPLRIRLNLWWQFHGQSLWKLAITTFILTDCAIIVFLGTQIRRYYIGQKNLQSQIESMASDSFNLSAIHDQLKPKPIGVEKTFIMRRGSKKVDLAAIVRNPNQSWGAQSFSYQFQGIVNASESKSDFLLPMDEKYIFDFDVSAADDMISLQIRDVNWVKSQTDQLPKINFGITEPEMIQSRVDETGGENYSSTSVRFQLTNESPFHFFQVSVKTILLRNNIPLAVKQIWLPKMISQQHENISLNFGMAIDPRADIKIFPEVNVLDSEIIFQLPDEAVGKNDR